MSNLTSLETPITSLTQVFKRGRFRSLNQKLYYIPFQPNKYSWLSLLVILKHLAVIEIEIAGVSSCQATVIEDQYVKKADQLDYF